MVRPIYGLLGLGIVKFYLYAGPVRKDKQVIIILRWIVSSTHLLLPCLSANLALVHS